MEGNTGRKGPGVCRETLTGRGWEFGGKHWQGGSGSLEGNTDRKGLGVWMETLPGRGRCLEADTGSKRPGVWRETLAGRGREFGGKY